MIESCNCKDRMHLATSHTACNFACVDCLVNCSVLKALNQTSLSDSMHLEVTSVLLLLLHAGLKMGLSDLRLLLLKALLGLLSGNNNVAKKQFLLITEQLLTSRPGWRQGWPTATLCLETSSQSSLPML